MSVKAEELAYGPYDTPAIRVTEAFADIGMEEARELVLQYLSDRSELLLMGVGTIVYHDGYLSGGRIDEILGYPVCDGTARELTEIIESSVDGVESFHPAECDGIGQRIHGVVREHAERYFAESAELHNEYVNQRQDSFLLGMGIASLVGTHQTVHTTAEREQWYAIEAAH